MPINRGRLSRLAHVALIANLYLGREPCLTWLLSRSESHGSSCSNELAQHGTARHGTARHGLGKTCQTAAAQRRPQCLSKIKQCLVSPPPLVLLLLLHTHAHTSATTSSSHPNCSRPREFNKEQIAVIGEQTAQCGGGSVITAAPNLINISVSLRLRLEKSRTCTCSILKQSSLNICSPTGHLFVTPRFGCRLLIISHYCLH